MASNGRYKVVLDTNWYVSATINRRSRRTLYDILTNKKLEIFYSKELLQEYQHVSISNKIYVLESKLNQTKS